MLRPPPVRSSRGVPVLRRPTAPTLAPVAARGARVAAALGLLLAAVGPLAPPVAAADAPTMEARVLLGGQARVGSWVAVSIHLRNDGPAVTGELRLAGGNQGETRFGTAVDLPTQSDKTYVLYAQPATFGNQLEVILAEGDRTVVTAKARFALNDATRLVVAVVAERPERIVGDIDLPPNQNDVAPLITTQTPDDLPERVEAWGAIDRVIWQDVDASRLTTAQLDSLRGWVAGGGRLVIAGGTAGPKTLTAFPDLLLPYRPVATTDTPASSLATLLGAVPADATTLPALSGELIAGRALATVGDQVVAAERPYGSGMVTLLGFDPGAGWIAGSDGAAGLWSRILPPRGSGGSVAGNDSMLVGALSQLPSLGLPPIGGLIALLAGYIILRGPITSLVLRRLDRREWAWLTMPLLIVAFAVGAYAFGAALRGSDVIVNEVAVVRGAAGTTDGAAQSYLGIFSPSRAVYQVRFPGGALVSLPVNGDVFAGTGTAPALDVLQGDPARVRNLTVGFGTLRSVRAETAVAVPLVEADLRLVDGRLQGTIRNASTSRLERPAVVLGTSVAVLPDMEPGTVQSIDVALQPDQLGRTLADRVVGQVASDANGASADASRLYVRRSMVEQLTNDPRMGSTNRLAADGPVVLAWGSNALVGVEIEGQQPNRVANVLYYLPTRLAIGGATTFRSDLIQSTLVDADAVVFSNEPTTIRFGRGSATMAYRPVAFDGTFTASGLTIALNGFDGGVVSEPTPIEPLPSIPPPCEEDEPCAMPVDGIPEVELLDLTSQTWRRLPHLNQGTRVSIADPARYVDPASGTVVLRFVNDVLEDVGVQADLTITGTIR